MADNTTEQTRCIECKHDKSTWNPVNGFCEFDADPENDEVDYCGCKCVFGFESEGERILYECAIRQVVAPEWGTPQAMITEFDEDKLISLINSGLAAKQTTTEQSVEDCLKELTNMFGHGQAVTISRFERWSTIAPDHLNWSISIGSQRACAPTLREAVDEACRQWHADQGKES